MSSIDQLVKVLCDCTGAVADILASTPVHHVGTENQFGDAQLSVDVQSDKKIFEILESSGIVSHAASEEEPELRNINSALSSGYVVCFDPLDGSSIVDCNWSVGSIFGIYDKSPIGLSGKDQVMAAVSVYGPRTTLIIAKRDGSVVELTRTSDKDWILTNQFENGIKADAKIFSPANLRSAQDLPGYASLVDSWMSKRLTLRYTGGMVPDVAAILIKGNGIFCSPVSSKAPAKLRLLFECAPIAFIVEAAGGLALTGREKNERILDVKIQSTDDRIGIVCGSRNEVERAVESIITTTQSQRIVSSGA
jgi:sedoheptulose-bisphosphatase